MGKIKIALDADIGYDSLPIPDKIVIPIEDGKIGVLSYKQHRTDPLTAEQIVIGYAGKDRLKINVRVTGRISVSDFPDLRLGGFKVEIIGGLTEQNLKLRLIDPQIPRWNLPNVPALLDNLIKQLLNKFLLKKLAEVLALDLKAPVQKAVSQINRPNVFAMAIGKNNLTYEFKPNVELFEPTLTISAEGLNLKFEATLAPAMTLIQPRMIRTALRSRRRRKTA